LLDASFRRGEQCPNFLPDFTRHLWASDAARARWGFRIEAIRRAWSEIEWLSVAEGVRRCALVSLSNAALPDIKNRWLEHRLSATSVPSGSSAVEPSRIVAFVGERSIVREALQAWACRDDEAIGALLGYPTCCRHFFHRIWVEEARLDTTLGMVSTGRPAGDRTFEVEPPTTPFANVLWRWLGLRAVPHLPCGFGCDPTMEMGRRFWNIAERSGYGPESEWIQQILSWPVEWSALHGIAEIRTPILKLITRTDHTDLKYTVRWRGENYPEEGAAGLAFPYRSKKRPAKLSLKSASAGETGAVAAGVLDGALAALNGEPVHRRHITDLRLTNYFNMVRLDDGSVGAALNYAALSTSNLDERRHALMAEIDKDPLLLQATTSADDLLLLSLRVATVSALSAPVIRRGGDPRFIASAAVPGAIFGAARSAVVIGFGGYMQALARSPSIQSLHVADLLYPGRRDEMDRVCARYQSERQGLRMTVSDGNDIWRRLASADLVCITASTLCNGSMEKLLKAAASCAKVIVQGQSGSIHPVGMFRRGVALVSTTLKPLDLIDLSDQYLRRTLEGGLPSIYLSPRNRVC
jgi:hypothetical protein